MAIFPALVPSLVGAAIGRVRRGRRARVVGPRRARAGGRAVAVGGARLGRLCGARATTPRAGDAAATTPVARGARAHGAARRAARRRWRRDAARSSHPIGRAHADARGERAVLFAQWDLLPLARHQQPRATEARVGPARALGTRGLACGAVGSDAREPLRRRARDPAARAARAALASGLVRAPRSPRRRARRASRPRRDAAAVGADAHDAGDRHRRGDEPRDAARARSAVNGAIVTVEALGKACGPAGAGVLFAWSIAASTTPATSSRSARSRRARCSGSPRRGSSCRAPSRSRATTTTRRPARRRARRRTPRPRAGLKPRSAFFLGEALGRSRRAASTSDTSRGFAKSFYAALLRALAVRDAGCPEVAAFHAHAPTAGTRPSPR